MPLGKTPQIHAQNSEPNGINDTNGILHTSQDSTKENQNDMSLSKPEPNSKNFKCFYCSDGCFESDSERQNHIYIKHPGKSLTNNNIVSGSTIYRLGHSDVFACKNCKQSGDKWYMLTHVCRGQ